MSYILVWVSFDFSPPCALEIHYVEKKWWLFEKKFLAVIYMKYVLLQFGPSLSWVYTYFHVVIERIATLHKNKIAFL